MTATLERAPQVAEATGTGNGGVAARRAVIRWGWRLFRREWRQQLLVLTLIIVAVAITIVGAAVSTNSPQPANFGFGTAQFSASVQGTPSQLRSGLSTLQHTYGRLDVIENQSLGVPGSISTFDLRAQNPHGPYGQAMLQLLSGHYPSAPDQVAVTSGVAADFHLNVGSRWSLDGRTWHVVGTVQNPQSLLDEFALVPPGQVPLTSSTQVTALFDASSSVMHQTGSRVQRSGDIVITSASSIKNTNILNPETITLTLATVGMLLIGLVAIAGFTVLAQRRLRSIGMLESLGATDANVRLVVRANGAAVGVVGAVLGAVLGFVLWALYRPHLEQSSHHLIGLMALPWAVIAISLALACITPYLAASRPARTITRVPIVTALSGRPAPPKQVTRSALPGIILAVIAFFLVGAAGSEHQGSGGTLPLVGGFVALIVAIVLLAPTFIGVLARVGRHTPLSVRLALRDLSRYRARSGAALGAISLGVFIAATICVVASARYANVLDYAGPNMASNQIVLYTPNGNPNGGNGPNGSPVQSGPNPSQKTLAADARAIARALGSRNVVELETTSVSLMRNTTGSNNFNGNIFVATPSLLHAFGISKREVNPKADFLTMRSGLDTESDMLMVFGGFFNGPQGNIGPNNAAQTIPCPRSTCQANPVIEYVPQLPSGTSAPNTVVTEHAIAALHLQGQVSNNGWLITAPSSLSAAQLTSAKSSAALDGMTVETKNDEPSSAEVINWATVAGLLLALAILAMTIGLIRSETASDLRTLTATGASRRTRRSITAATAGALALLGAVLGTAAGYLVAAAYFRTSELADQSMLTNISQVPLSNLLLILVGMPLVAYLVAYLFAGRQPPMVSRQPIE
jgi:putative ABC transport system permease protein